MLWATESLMRLIQLKQNWKKIGTPNLSRIGNYVFFHRRPTYKYFDYHDEVKATINFLLGIIILR
ncbi:CPS_collapsed_G0002610.mRNA.1.CDS.1 [Saccharomyces cerevisiae]|nr:CPS_collapsed_G0002610.mRNA.1.CDS.1 [Saccharomyces cerevisiae]